MTLSESLLCTVLLLCVARLASGAEQSHPRPDFERENWQSLNGAWQFAFDPEDVGLKEAWYQPTAKPYPLQINVPFPWESRLSGIGRTHYKGVAWYRREFTVPAEWQGERIRLCFGAVDWQATVWLNDTKIGEHEGGYSEFRFDITQAVRFNQPNLLVVRVVDFTDHETPIGKQTPGWYTSTSGIWQTVWLETTGQAYVQRLRIVPLADEKGVPTGEVRFEIEIERGNESSDLVVEIRSPDRKFAKVSQPIPKGVNQAAFTIKVNSPKFWTPDTPTLYPAIITLDQATANRQLQTANRKLQPLDEVQTYFGIRTVSWGKYDDSPYSYVLLNGKPIYLRGALDQSFNPEGIYTAPDDAFLQRDIELAKAAGFNMLRIHIKADEPRRLYWADKLGVLIQADIPCFYNISERARRTFEMTLRDQIARDFNHPSIYCWTIFNEEWGIGNLGNAPREHRVDWVEQMFKLTRELDPTRLVQDNTGWSHLMTDLNSFHWYGRDVDGFRRGYRNINDNQIKPGDTWNYIADRKQRGEPFVNNEFGYVSAGNGDGDWSWGVLYLVNALRACEKLVGYTYTELTDIEWEHNGVYNYDRSPKEFGYEFWMPGMGLEYVFSEDFLVLEVPAIKTAKPGETVSVPVRFSHYSGKHSKDLTLKWQLRWLDSLGQWHEEAVQSRACIRTPPYRLTHLGIIEFRLPNQPCLATLAVWLEDRGERVHCNYTQWRLTTGSPLPRVEVLDEHTVLLRFRPEDWARSQFSEQNMPTDPLAGKHYGRGYGAVEYRLKLPENLPVEALQSATLACEVAAKAGREKVDWSQRVHPEDYPQTDVKKFPSTVQVRFNGVEVAIWNLPDDPADARGVLSHWRGIERGSYGYRMEATTQDDKIISALRTSRRLNLVLEVPKEAPPPGGIALYGEQMGCYPMEPTLILQFSKPLSLPRGWSSNEAVTIDRFWDRLQGVLASARRGGTPWRYTTEQPPENWFQPDFNDSAWQEGKSGFGTQGTPGSIIGTEWNTGDIWLRKILNLPKLSPEDILSLEVHHDEDCQIYVNGHLLWSGRGYLTAYKVISLTPEQRALFWEGSNTIAVHCRQTAGGQFIDVGLTLVPGGE